jgi:hypothetical protein
MANLKQDRNVAEWETFSKEEQDRRLAEKAKEDENREKENKEHKENK